jgi:PAS domain S-box-containing protein
VPPRARVHAAERAAALADVPYDGDREVRDRAGRIFTVRVTSTVMLDDGRPTGSLAVSYDVSARRQAECDARQLAAIVEGSGDTIIQTDVDGLIRSANAAVGTTFGYDPAGLVGRDIALLIPAGERPKIEAAIACVRAGGSPGVLLTRSAHLDGTVIDVALRLSAVRDDAGHRRDKRDHPGRDGRDPDPGGSGGQRAPVPARFEQTQVSQAVLALHGTLVAVNDALCLLLGHDRAELEGLDVRQLRHPRDVPQVPDPLAAVLVGTVDAGTWERTMVGPDGCAIPAIINVALLRDADGVPYGVGAFVQDLSELRRAERALTRREALFEALERQANDWTMVIDANAVLLYVSPRVLDVLGYVPESIIGRSGWDFVHPDDLSEVRRSVGRVVDCPCASETIVFRGPDATEAWRWVENVFTNCLDDPDIAGIVCTGRDVSARVEAQDVTRRPDNHRLPPLDDNR